MTNKEKETLNTEEKTLLLKVLDSLLDYIDKRISIASEHEECYITALKMRELLENYFELIGKDVYKKYSIKNTFITDIFKICSYKTIDELKKKCNIK
jgi:hypothetical protein